MDTVNEDILVTIMGYLDDHYQRYSFMSVNKMNYEYTANWRKRDLSVYSLQVPPYFLETRLSDNVYIPSNIFDDADGIVYAVVAALRENIFTIIYTYKKNMNKWISVFQKFTNVYNKDVTKTKVICHGIHKYDINDVILNKQILVTYPAVMKNFDGTGQLLKITDYATPQLYAKNGTFRSIDLSTFEGHNKLIKFEENIKPTVINKQHFNDKPTSINIIRAFIDSFDIDDENKFYDDKKECTIAIIANHESFKRFYHVYGTLQPDGSYYNKSFNYEYNDILICAVVLFNTSMSTATKFTNIINFEGYNIDQILNKRCKSRKVYRVLYYDGSYNASFRRKLNGMTSYIDNKDLKYILFILKLWNIDPLSISKGDIELLLNMNGGNSRYNYWYKYNDNKLTQEQAKLYLNI